MAAHRKAIVSVTRYNQLDTWLLPLARPENEGIRAAVVDAVVRMRRTHKTLMEERQIKVKAEELRLLEEGEKASAERRGKLETLKARHLEDLEKIGKVVTNEHELEAEFKSKMGTRKKGLASAIEYLRAHLRYTAAASGKMRAGALLLDREDSVEVADLLKGALKRALEGEKAVHRLADGLKDVQEVHTMALGRLQAKVLEKTKKPGHPPTGPVFESAWWDWHWFKFGNDAIVTERLTCSAGQECKRPNKQDPEGMFLCEWERGKLPEEMLCRRAFHGECAGKLPSPDDPFYCPLCTAEFQEAARAMEESRKAQAAWNTVVSPKKKQDSKKRGQRPQNPPEQKGPKSPEAKRRKGRKELVVD